MRKSRRTAVGFVVVSTIDLDRSALLWEDASLAEELETRERPFGMLLVAALAIVGILVFAPASDIQPHVVSRFPNVPGVQGSQAITGEAVPIPTTLPEGIKAEAFQDSAVKVVRGVQANEQFRVTSENAADRALRRSVGGDPVAPLPDGAIVTVTDIVTLDNQWVYVYGDAGAEGWIQLKVLRRLTND